MATITISPLRQRMIEDMNARKLTAGTQTGHLRACRRFAAFLKRSPDTVDAEDIRRFQLGLAQSGVSITTRNRTMTGLRFLFRVTLRRLDLAAAIYHIREPQKIPLVISTDEAKRLLAPKASRFACCSASPMAAACAPARWCGSGSATSTARKTSFASSRPRGARTATSCCRPKCSLCCANGGRCARAAMTAACRRPSAGCSRGAGSIDRSLPASSTACSMRPRRRPASPSR